MSLARKKLKKILILREKEQEKAPTFKLICFQRESKYNYSERRKSKRRTNSNAFDKITEIPQRKSTTMHCSMDNN